MSSFADNVANCQPASGGDSPTTNATIVGVEENETRCRRIGAELAASRTNIDNIYRRARKAAAVASDAGDSHRRIAEWLGVDRMTVRKWVGKR